MGEEDKRPPVRGYETKLDDNRAVFFSRDGLGPGNHAISFTNGAKQTHIGLSDEALRALIDLYQAPEQEIFRWVVTVNPDGMVASQDASGRAALARDAEGR